MFRCRFFVLQFACKGTKVFLIFSKKQSERRKIIVFHDSD